MRALLFAFIGFLYFFDFAQSAFAEDAVRRLPRIQVTALPPHMGTVYANAYTIRQQDFERPGFRSIEIRFSPVEFSADGSIIPELQDSQTDYSIKTNIPQRAENLNFTDSIRDFYTQDIALPSGAYIISEIIFRTEIGSTYSDASYCLSKGTLLFEIIGRDTLFLGRLNLDYPPNTPAERRHHTPLESMGKNLQKMKGWRWTTTDLLNLDVRTISFNPSVCAPDSYQVSAWEKLDKPQAYSAGP